MAGKKEVDSITTTTRTNDLTSTISQLVKTVTAAAKEKTKKIKKLKHLMSKTANKYELIPLVQKIVDDDRKSTSGDENTIQYNNLLNNRIKEIIDNNNNQNIAKNSNKQNTEEDNIITTVMITKSDGELLTELYNVYKENSVASLNSNDVNTENNVDDLDGKVVDKNAESILVENVLKKIKNNLPENDEKLTKKNKNEKTVKKLSVEIDITAQHMLFNSEHFGNFEYPKLWMRQNLIYILGSGAWGTFLTSTTGKDWQLYLMNKKEMSDLHLIPAIEVYSEGLQKKTTTCTLLSNSVQLYANFIARKCLNGIHVDDDGKVVRLKR
jgi:hypothetical protein